MTDQRTVRLQKQCSCDLGQELLPGKKATQVFLSLYQDESLLRTAMITIPIHSMCQENKLRGAAGGSSLLGVRHGGGREDRCRLFWKRSKT